MTVRPASASNDARAATQGGVALLGLQTLGRALVLVFVVVATRTVTPAEFGRFSIATSLVFFGTFLADFGTTPVITRWSSRRPGESEALLSTAVVFSLGLGLAGYLLALAYAALAPYSSSVRADIALAGLAIPATAVLTSLQAGLDGRGHISRRALVTFTNAALSSVGGAIAVRATGDIRWAMGALVVAPTVSVALALGLTRRLGVWSGRLAADRTILRRVVVTAVPFALFGGLSALSGRFDVLLLSIIRDRPTTASYDLALRTTEAATFMATALTAPALYLLSGRLGRGDHQGAQRAFTQLVRACHLLGLLLASILVAAGTQVTSIMFGEAYPDTARLVRILGATLWLSFTALAQGALIASGDHLYRGLRTSAAITFTYVGLTVALATRWGATGAAVATAVAQLITVIAFARFHRATTGIRTPLPAPGALAGALTAVAVGLALADEPAAVVLIGVSLAFGAVALVGKAVTGDDLDLTRRLLRGGRDA